MGDLKELGDVQGSLRTKRPHAATWNASFSLRRVYGTWGADGTRQTAPANRLLAKY